MLAKEPHRTALGVEIFIVSMKVWESRVGGSAGTGPWGSSAGMCAGPRGDGHPLLLQLARLARHRVRRMNGSRMGRGGGRGGGPRAAPTPGRSPLPALPSMGAGSRFITAPGPHPCLPPSLPSSFPPCRGSGRSRGGAVGGGRCRRRRRAVPAGAGGHGGQRAPGGGGGRGAGGAGGGPAAPRTRLPPPAGGGGPRWRPRLHPPLRYGRRGRGRLREPGVGGTGGGPGPGRGAAVPGCGSCRT